MKDLLLGTRSARTVKVVDKASCHRAGARKRERLRSLTKVLAWLLNQTMLPPKQPSKNSRSLDLISKSYRSSARNSTLRSIIGAS